MDTKQKAEAYDKLLIKAKQIYNKENDVLIMHTLEDLFPEFKESEDERIRKHLISLVKNWDKDGIASKYTSDPNNIKQILTWLEKQGKPIDEEKVLIGARKDIALSIMDFLDKNTLGMCLSNMECEDLEDAVVNSDWSKIYDYMKKKLEKQNEQKPYGQRKECSDCQFNYAGKCKGSCQMKRNEQKTADTVEPKFKVKDWVINTLPGVKYPHLITDIRDGYYIFGKDNDRAHIASSDNILKLWTIDDAKPGDVLADRFGKDKVIILYKGINPKLSILAYCGWNGYNLSIKTNGLGYGNLDNTNYVPATKEQRELLFQKIKEAGYEWDAENLQLTKIFYVKKLSDGINIDKQKTAEWSEEDEEYNGEDYGIDGLWHAKNILEETLGKVDGYQSDDGILEHKCAITVVNKLYKQKLAWSEEDKWMIQTICHAFEKGSSQYIWLKSLKDRVLPQPKQEWSEEDERIYQSIIDDTVQENQLDSKQIDWLKSIKSRVQPKQEWSEEDKVRIEQICDDLECGLENFRSGKNVKGLHFEEIIESNIDWLKSLKDRIQPKQEWSDEDETERINTIIMLKEGASLHFNKRDVTKSVNWLKSLKPQNRWKPSKEQIDALNNARWNVPFSIEILDSLYNDLKKLIETEALLKAEE